MERTQGIYFNGVAVIDRSGRFPINSLLEKQFNTPTQGRELTPRQLAILALTTTLVTSPALLASSCDGVTSAYGHRVVVTSSPVGSALSGKLDIHTNAGPDCSAAPVDQQVETPPATGNTPFTVIVTCPEGQATITGNVNNSGDVADQSSNP